MSPIPLRLLAVASGLGLLSAACAARQDVDENGIPRGDTTRSGFPTPQALSALLARTPAPALEAARAAKDIDSWELSGPFPESMAAPPQPDGSPWARALQDALSRRAGMAVGSAGMDCAARELGRYALKHRARAGPLLTRYIAARCGVATAGISTAYFQGEVPESVTEQQLFDHWKGELKSMLESAVSPGLRTAGVWFGRDGRHALVAFASGHRAAHLEPTPIRPAGATVELRGELLERAEELYAVAAHGEFEIVVCENDPAVRLPAFHVRCPVDPQAPRMWIQVLARPSGRLLATSALSLLALPRADEDGRRYSLPTLGGLEEKGADFDNTFAGLLNSVRAQAGMEPLQLALRQSAAAQRLAPHYFAALSGLEPEAVADVVLLGLHAGWDVDGLVRDAQFASNSFVSGGGPAALLAAMLEIPVGRQALLDRDARQLALGTVVANAEGDRAGLLVTYKLFDVRPDPAAPQKVLDALAKARAAEGRPAPRLLSALQRLADEARVNVAEGRRAPRDALEELMQSVSRTRSGARVMGWMLQTSSLDDLSFPPEMLRERDTEVLFSVVAARGEGEPWGRYYVMLVMIVPQMA